MKILHPFLFVLLLSQCAVTMERRNQALTNLSNQTNSLSNAADEFVQAATNLHQQIRAQEEQESKRGAGMFTTILRELYEEAKQQKEGNSAPQQAPANHSVHATAAPATCSTQTIILRSNEIKKRLSQLENSTSSTATEERMGLLVELAELTKEGIQEISRENACSATLTRATTQSCPLINSPVPDAAIQAAAVKDKAIRETINKGNNANKNARKWFFFSVAGFSFTFFSWKYNWMPEKATYACGAASTFFGLKTLQWSYYKLQEYKKLAELRKK